MRKETTLTLTIEGLETDLSYEFGVTGLSDKKIEEGVYRLIKEKKDEIAKSTLFGEYQIFVEDEDGCVLGDGRLFANAFSGKFEYMFYPTKL